MTDKKLEDQFTIDPLSINEEELSLELTLALLNSCIKENTKLEKIISKLNKREVELRDDLAAKIYASLITISTAELAAEDAYKAADIFLRVREGGKITK